MFHETFASDYFIGLYDDFASLPQFNIYIKLLIDGTESKGFSAVTIEQIYV